jgi:hypothetical protein
MRSSVSSIDGAVPRDTALIGSAGCHDFAVSIWHVSGTAAKNLPKMPLTCGGAGAPGRIRTCDTGFRRAVLYPLSYEGLRHL